METRANFALIGLFVIGVIAAGFGFTYWLLKGGDNAVKRDVVVVFNTSVSGLATGSAVTFNGISIGQVARLSFAPNDPNQVLAYISVDPNSPLKRDTRAQLGFSGLTGVASIQLEGGSREQPNLFDGEATPIIHADRSAVQNLLEGARQVVAKADSTLSTIDVVVRENAPAVAKSVQNVKTFTDALAAHPEALERFMADIGRAADVLSRVADKLGPLIEHADELVKSIDTAKVATTVENVTRTSTEMAAAASEAQGLVKDARAVVASLDQAKLRASVDALAALATQIQSHSGDVERILGGSAETVETLRNFAADLSRRTADIDRILANGTAASDDVRKLTGGLANRSGEIDQIIVSARDLTQRLAEASKRVDGILAGVDGLVTSPEGKGLFAQGREFLSEATLTARQFREMAATYDTRGQELFANLNRLATTGLREVRDLVSDGRRSLQSLDRAASEVERNPQRFIYGSSPVREYQPQRR